MSDFAWLNYDSRPGAWMAEASCFTFIRSRSARWAADTAGLADVEEVDFSAVEDYGSEFTEFGIGLYDESEWAVIYQWNGFPEQFVRDLVERQEVDEAVIVFWNVNSVVEFSYYRRGSMVVGFEFPDERWGADPDALLGQMDRARVTMQTYESTDEKWAGVLPKPVGTRRRHHRRRARPHLSAASVAGRHGRRLRVSGRVGP